MPQSAIAVAGTAGLPVVCRFSELWFASTFLRGDRFLRHLTSGERGLRGAWASAVRPANRHPALRLDTPPRVRASLSWASAALRDLAGRPDGVDVVAERVIHPATPRQELFSAIRREPSEAPLIVYVGRLTTPKGAEVAVEALAALHERHDVHGQLQFAGPFQPAMGDGLRALARERGVGGHVDLLGPLEPAELAALLARATALVLPSIAPEAFPLVALEAALARVPIVASRAGGIPEGLADEEHALLFEPGDADGCARALARIVAEPQQAGDRAGRAAARAREFSLETYLTRSEELIVDAAG